MRRSAIIMLTTAERVACRHAAAVDRRRACSISTAAASASSHPTRDAGYSAPLKGVRSVNRPSASARSARPVTRALRALASEGLRIVRKIALLCSSAWCEAELGRALVPHPAPLARAHVLVQPEHFSGSYFRFGPGD